MCCLFDTQFIYDRKKINDELSCEVGYNFFDPLQFFDFLKYSLKNCKKLFYIETLRIINDRSKNIQTKKELLTPF